MTTIFFRLINEEDKGVELWSAINALETDERFFAVDPRNFSRVPRSPFAYWASQSLLRLFEKLPSFEEDRNEAGQGLATNGDFRWLRLWSEIDSRLLRSDRSLSSKRAWVPYAKGGGHARFYADIHLVVEWGFNGRSLGADEEEEEEAGAVIDEGTAQLSWSIGVAFGRFDIRLATRERAIPAEPAPFDPLPAKSPGMLPDGDAPFMPCSGVLVDDLGHADDLGARVIAIYDRVGEPVPEPDTIRRSLAREFFPAHIKMYSKSRRKAPIYWQLATPSARYSVWLYIHAFGKDTLFRVQTDYVTPKLTYEQRELEGLLADTGPSPTSAQRKAIDAQEGLVEELHAFRQEVARIAPLWNPDLNDGVVINFAPLWRLVPHHRAWQRECKACWETLVAGDYDWSHLAMHLWPERVVPKCADDRSLAITHGLEDVFWFEDEDGKWKRREVPARPVDELVRERSSAAVKAALKSLLEAPAANGGSRRGRRRTAR
jgi:hypothetical protein